MVFTSVLFLLVFLPLVLLLYYFAPHRYKNGVALGASLLFYMWGAPAFFWLLIGLLIANFYLVKSMHQSTNAKLRHWLLVGSLSINLGVLAYFKYANFFVENVNALFPYFGFSSINWVAVALPIGISFFTFQSITYTLDVYWKRHVPLDKISDYLLYILLFPQLIAGPIIRFSTIAGEIKDRTHNFNSDFRLNGVYIFVIGLAKKVLIANQVGEQVDLIFAQGDSLSTYASWIGIIAYSIQIYFDFSGYSDMAIGLGRILGFNFPENFKNPYTAESITDFWRKWHITLGAFMRDYLYIPLGGNRSGVPLRNYLNLVIVFLLSGLWHGASWNFVIWGAWHGVFLTLERAFLNAWLQKVPKLLRLFYAYLVVLIGWVFFRADTLPQAYNYLTTMFGGSAPAAAQPVGYEVDFYLFLALGILFSIITLFKFGKKMETFFFYTKYSVSSHLALSFFSLLIFIISLGYVASSGFNPFIYFRF